MTLSWPIANAWVSHSTGWSADASLTYPQTGTTPPPLQRAVTWSGCSMGMTCMRGPRSPLDTSHLITKLECTATAPGESHTFRRLVGSASPKAPTAQIFFDVIAGPLQRFPLVATTQSDSPCALPYPSAPPLSSTSLLCSTRHLTPLYIGLPSGRFSRGPGACAPVSRISL